MDVVLSQADGVSMHIDLGEPLLPVWIVRPVWIRIRQVAVLDSPMDAVAISASDDAHSMRVAHHHAAASSSHVATHAVPCVLPDDGTMEHLERPDAYLASLIDKLDAVFSKFKQLVECERIHAG